MREHPRWMHGLFAAVLCSWLVGWAQAADAPAEPRPDSLAPHEARLDERAQRLSAELRCLVCQNQTIADSQAELAMQLKREVRQQLARGASDQQVRDFMVQRYGDFVLYRPPVNRLTLLLWFGPMCLLILGLALFVWQWRERRRAQPDAPDSVLPLDEVLP